MEIVNTFTQNLEPIKVAFVVIVFGLVLAFILTKFNGGKTNGNTS
jgi:hypothetical protein